MHALGPGDRIEDNYVLEVLIGTGAMGAVFRATQLGLDRQVAIKVLHAGQAMRPEARLRFRREAKVAARLRHPAVVTVLDYGEVGDQPYLVMELLEGETLRAALDRRRLPLELVLHVTCEVARALEAAHDIGLVHRDIKPENIFLETTPDELPAIRVVDFGLAFMAEDDDASVGRLTAEGIVGGTPAYISPEQVHGRGIGPAADIYGLGCVLFELLAGRPPFAGALGEVLTRQAYAAPPALAEIPGATPTSDALTSLLTRMLAKSAPLRPSATHVVTSLGVEIDDARYHIRDQQRARDLAARSERAFAPPPPAAQIVGHGAAEPATVFWLQPSAAAPSPPEGLEAALGAMGLSLRVVAGIAEEVLAAPPARACLIVPHQSPLALQALTRHAMPVLVILPGIGELAQALQTGIADAVFLPLVPEAVARRVARVLTARSNP